MNNTLRALTIPIVACPTLVSPAHAWGMTGHRVTCAIAETYLSGERDVAWGYVFDHRATYKTQLEQSGIRLAAYLNETLAPEEELEE